MLCRGPTTKKFKRRRQVANLCNSSKNVDWFSIKFWNLKYFLETVRNQTVVYLCIEKTKFCSKTMCTHSKWAFEQTLKTELQYTFLPVCACIFLLLFWVAHEPDYPFVYLLPIAYKYFTFSLALLLSIPSPKY